MNKLNTMKESLTGAAGQILKITCTNSSSYIVSMLTTLNLLGWALARKMSLI